MRFPFIVLFLIALNIHFFNRIGAINNQKSKTIDSIPSNAKKLINCYKGYVIGYSNNYIIFKDKSKIIWDDGIKDKSIKLLLEKPDLKDMFREKYNKGHVVFPSTNSDPGRIRNKTFFMKIYGLNKKDVENNLTEITWCPKLIGQKITVTKINDVDQKLIQISNELDTHPEFKKYLTNIGGTFNWRNIKGTDRPSMHSFGMTIDINTKYSDYWQWTCKCTDESTNIKYENKIPLAIVSIFEKYGFIWGGKWYHYDTMHFEYRPELL